MAKLSVFDLIFPKSCVGCNGEGSWLCQECYASLYEPMAACCADCQRLTGDGRYCHFHRNDHALTGLIYVGQFKRGPLREAIHTFKYNKVLELAKPLACLLAKRLTEHPHLAGANVIPIPLHPARQVERGFNQAELLVCELPYPNLRQSLVRYRKTMAQASLSLERRRTNMNGAFGVRTAGLSDLRNRLIVLVDDVATTGSTLDAAAVVLKKAGVKAVWGAVIAKD